MTCFYTEGRPPFRSQSASTLWALVHSYLIPTLTQWRHRQDKHTTLKQVIWRETVPLVIPIADALPQEGLLMWNSHYLMRNFTLISWTDQSAQSGYASLDKVQDILQVGIPASLLLGFTTTIQFSFYSRKFPLGLNPVAGGIWSLCANRTHHSLTAFSESTQNAQNWHCNKCGMKKDATQTLWIAFGSVR